jgi:hypothetical protein
MILKKHDVVGILIIVLRTSRIVLEYMPIVLVNNFAYLKWQVKGKLVLIIGNEADDIHLFLEKDDDEMLTISIMNMFKA